MLYLNENMIGGETELFWHNVTIQPKTGLLLTFRHRQLHAENTIKEGVKYVLRSDVMCRVSSKQNMTTFLKNK